MKGILVDVNLRGQMARIHTEILSEWSEYWEAIGTTILSFADVDLVDTTPDDQLWRTCQENEWILITGNRNSDGEDSLGETIQRENTENSLPVLTIGRTDEVLTSINYLQRVTEKLIDYLINIENIRGAGRLYLP